MVAPAVAVLIVTDTAPLYEPPGGLKVGVATVLLMMYVADATSELVMPDLSAMALIVLVEGTLIGPEYRSELAVGVLPSIVYLIVAPVVAVVMVTDCVPLYVPPGGLKVGVATFVLLPPPCV